MGIAGVLLHGFLQGTKPSREAAAAAARFCQLQALDPESAVVFLGPNTSWLSGPFQAFTQLEGHLPPLLAQL